MSAFIGVCLAIVGGVVQSFGFILQKLGHNDINSANENKPKDEHKSIFTSWKWLLGIAVYTTGGTLNAIALIFAAQSVVSPLGALNLAVIALLSYFILKEPLGKKDIVAIIFIMIGSVLVVVFGPQTDDNSTLSIDDLLKLYTNVGYIVFVVVLTGLAVLDYIGVRYAEYRNFKSEDNQKIVYGEKFLLLSYTLISAYFASLNTIFLKSLVTLISSSFSSQKDLSTNATNVASYAILIMFVVCLLSMEYFRQKALSYFGALYVVPMFSVTAIILTSMLGAVYFQEFDGMSGSDIALMIVGILVTVLGVVVLSYDVMKLFSDENIEKFIKVAFLDLTDDELEIRYPPYMVVGGPMAERWQRYLLAHKAFVFNPEYEKDTVDSNTIEIL